MLELDLVLMPFVENVFLSLPDDEQQLYWQLMECEDQDMFNWFIHSKEPEDADIKKIVDIVRSHTGKKPD